MRIVGVMPLKLNNERLPGKNTLLLGDRPLFVYQLDAILKTKLCDDVFVFCSDASFAASVPSGVTFLQREHSLDLPTSNFTQIFESFMSKIDADIYVYIHATAPFVSINTILDCINAVKCGDYDSAFCAVKIQDFLWKDGKPMNFDASNLPRSQDLEPIYRETSGVYVFKKCVFEKYRRRVGINPYVKPISYKESVDINTLEDFNLANALLGVDL